MNPSFLIRAGKQLTARCRGERPRRSELTDLSSTVKINYSRGSVYSGSCGFMIKMDMSPHRCRPSRPYSKLTVVRRPWPRLETLPLQYCVFQIAASRGASRSLLEDRRLPLSGRDHGSSVPRVYLLCYSVASRGLNVTSFDPPDRYP